MAGWNYYADGTDNIAQWDGVIRAEDISSSVGTQSQLNVSGITVSTSQGSGILITNTGVGPGMSITQTSGVLGALVIISSNDDNVAGATPGMRVTSSYPHTSSSFGRALAKISNTSPISIMDNLYLGSDNSGKSLTLDQNSGTVAQYIDMDTADTTTQVYGLQIDVDTTGGGAPVALNLSTMSSGEAVMKVTPSGSGVSVQAGYFSIASGTTIYKVPFYS